MLCPKCKKVIGYIRYESSGVKTYKMYNHEGNVEYEEETDFIEGDNLPKLFCPECNYRFVFDEAQEIVLGEDKLIDMVAEKISKIKKIKK